MPARSQMLAGRVFSYNLEAFDIGPSPKAVRAASDGRSGDIWRFFMHRSFYELGTVTLAGSFSCASTSFEVNTRVWKRRSVRRCTAPL